MCVEAMRVMPRVGSPLFGRSWINLRFVKQFQPASMFLYLSNRTANPNNIEILTVDAFFVLKRDSLLVTVFILN